MVTTEYLNPPAWGVKHTVALSLALLELDIVQRSTLRALLPAGRTKHLPQATAARRATAGSTKQSRNVISIRFGDALKRLEEAGLVTRGTEHVLVRNRRGLMDLAMTAAPARNARLFEVAAAIDQLNAELRARDRLTPKAIEQRRRELLALKRLMEEGFGSANWSGRGSVRFIPGSSPL